MKIAVNSNGECIIRIRSRLPKWLFYSIFDRDFLPTGSFAYGGTNKSPLEVRGELISRSVLRPISRQNICITKYEPKSCR